MNELSFGGVPPHAVGPGPAEHPDARVRRPALIAAPVLMHYLHVALRWKWLLIGSVALSLILGLVLTLLMTPQYTATATVEIQRESARIVNVQGVEPEASPVDLEFYQTQYGLLQSETLAQRVATELRLYDNAEFFEMFGQSKTADELREAGRGNANSRNKRIRLAAKLLLNNLAIDPQRLSRLVFVRFTSPDAGLSAQVVNTWTRLFIETSLGRRFEATSYARTFLEERLAQLRERLQDSERALVGYAANERIVTIPANAQGGAAIERPVVAENLAAANADLNSATALRIAAESRLRGNSGASTEALQNQAISELRTRRAQVAADRARMLTQFEPDYPPAQALADQIAELDRSIAREEARVRETLQSQYSQAAARENTVRGRVAKLESDLVDLRRRTIQYNIYQREVDTNRQLYDALLQRYKEIGVAGGVGVNNISIVDPALVPDKPSSPHFMLNLLIATALGMAIGAGLALLLDQADETISDPRELEKLGLPLLGTIPKSLEEDPVSELNDPKSSLVDAYLSVQTRLAFTTEHGVPRTLTITSTRPGEGKSITAHALARSLIRTGRRVVIVDADMRSPSQQELFGLKNEHGLSNFLSGTDDIASLLQTQPETGLMLLSSGPVPPNAAELLTSGRFAQLIGELATKFDHVIVDAPPVMGLADTPLIASRVEGCIFVVESHKTRATMAQVALERLQSSTVRVLGGVLTMFDTKRAHFGYGYDYGYSYGARESEPA